MKSIKDIYKTTKIRLFFKILFFKKSKNPMITIQRKELLKKYIDNL